MMKSFLDKYDTIIFDLDGVLTSEQNYWDSAALTVVEFLKSKRYLGNDTVNTAEMSEKVAELRREVFVNDELITFFKGIGVNSNWDLGYVTVLISLILDSVDFNEILEYAKTLSNNILDEYERLAEQAAYMAGLDYEYTKRNGRLWTDMRDCFQEWFLGDRIFCEQYGRTPFESGKPGLIYKECPIPDLDDLKKLLGELSKTKRLCTGTGRQYAEMKEPLENWGIMKYFSQDGLCNFTHVTEAEKRFDNFALTKPHPYMFLKALYGTDYDDEKLIHGDYDKEKIERTLVVGDAGADILAARAMGADFCAVLTGVSGKSARSYFKELKAEYILDSVIDMM